MKGEKGEKGDKGDPGSTRWADIIDKPNLSKYLDFTLYQNHKWIKGPVLLTYENNQTNQTLYTQATVSPSTTTRMAGYFQLMESGYSKASANLAFRNGTKNYAGWFSGDVFISGNLTTTSCIGCSSDKRFKKNVVKIESAMEKIEQLQGVSFEWKRDQYPEKKFKNGRQLGVIAQETQKILPEAVSAHEGHLYVSYDQITPVLIEALKEQQATIRKLMEKLNSIHSDLKNQRVINRTLHDRLTKIEQIIIDNGNVQNKNVALNKY